VQSYARSRTRPPRGRASRIPVHRHSDYGAIVSSASDVRSDLASRGGRPDQLRDASRYGRAVGRCGTVLAVASRLSPGDTRGSRVFLTSRPVAATAAVGYVLLLQYVYVVYVAPDFAYLQCGYRTPDPLG
jgi:hypothetical protein